MAILTDINYKGITIPNVYLKIKGIDNKGEDLLLNCEAYSFVDGEKSELLGTHRVSVTPSIDIMDLAYNALKSEHQGSVDA